MNVPLPAVKPATTGLCRLRIAVPLTAADQFSAHYGAAKKFIVFETAADNPVVTRRTIVVPPEGGPCHWLPLLRAAGVDVMLAGAMGQGALQNLSGHGIAIVTGVRPAEPEKIVQAWLAGALVPGANGCRGGHHHAPDSHEGHEHGCGCAH